MRIKLFCIISIFAFHFVEAQTVFHKLYGKTPQDYAYCAKKTFDKGYIISGLTNGYGGTNYLYLIKTDLLGDTLWVKAYPASGIIYGYSIQQTSDSGYIVAGNNGVIKTDKNGNILWGNNYQSAGFFSVRQTSDGGYILSGNIGTSGSSNGIDVYLLKLNSSGVKMWSRKLGGSGDDISNCVLQTNDGGYISVGGTTSFGAGNYDVYLLRTNANGDTLWTKTYGGNNIEGGISGRQTIEKTNDGGYIIGSYTSSFGTGGTDAYLIKTDSGGAVVWSKTYGGIANEIIFSVKPTNDGGYIFTGSTNSFGAGNSDVYLVKTNSVGDTLWTKAYGSANSDIGQSVVETDDKGYLIAGHSTGYINSNNDVLLIKTDSIGNTSCGQSNTSSQVNSATTLVGNTATGKIFITINISGLNPVAKRGGTIIDVCSIIGIQPFEKQNAFLTVFPNPTTGKFVISLAEKNSEKIKISISNILGEIIYNAESDNNIPIDLSNVPNGVYILKAESHKIFTQQIIINK